MKNFFFILALCCSACAQVAEDQKVLVIKSASIITQIAHNVEDTIIKNPDDSLTPKSLRYLALGDSYTIGESVLAAERYPDLIVKMLNDKGLITKPPLIIARTGWTTDELAAAIVAANPTDDFEMVSLLIGVNNQYRGYPIQTYRIEFEQLLQTAIKKAAGDARRVFVLSIPDYGVTPFAQNLDIEKIAKEIDDFNAINKQIAGLYKVAYFDITPISREARFEPSLIAADGLHPSGKMYARWVDRFSDKILSIAQAR